MGFARRYRCIALAVLGISSSAALLAVSPRFERREPIERMQAHALSQQSSCA